MTRLKYIFVTTSFFKYGKIYDVLAISTTHGKAQGEDGKIHIISLNCFDK